MAAIPVSTAIDALRKRKNIRITYMCSKCRHFYPLSEIKGACDVIGCEDQVCQGCYDEMIHVEDEWFGPDSKCTFCKTHYHQFKKEVIECARDFVEKNCETRAAMKVAKTESAITAKVILEEKYPSTSDDDEEEDEEEDEDEEEEDEEESEVEEEEDADDDEDDDDVEIIEAEDTRKKLWALDGCKDEVDYIIKAIEKVRSAKDEHELPSLNHLIPNCNPYVTEDDCLLQIGFEAMRDAMLKNLQLHLDKLVK